MVHANLIRDVSFLIIFHTFFRVVLRLSNKLFHVIMILRMCYYNLEKPLL